MLFFLTLLVYTVPHIIVFGAVHLTSSIQRGPNTYLRLDNTCTGVCKIEVYPSLLCDQMSEKVNLYIKLKQVIFSFISQYSHSTDMVSNYKLLI